MFYGLKSMFYEQIINEQQNNSNEKTNNSNEKTINSGNIIFQIICTFTKPTAFWANISKQDAEEARRLGYPFADALPPQNISDFNDVQCLRAAQTL